MLIAARAVEIRVLSRQGKSIREIARDGGSVAQHGTALRSAGLKVLRIPNDSEVGNLELVAGWIGEQARERIKNQKAT
ncbi:MAG: hypothetical protein ACREQI_00465 [Candidatus Binataceae bacterium]